jgi:H+/gluconate symporter-like permease
MGYYHNILNLLSLALIFAILFIVIYGCQFKKYRYIEKFSNDEEEEKEIKKEENKKPEEFKSSLEKFEVKILNGLNDGSITNDEMEKLIENGTFTRKNLENIIEYIDNFKDNITL